MEDNSSLYEDTEELPVIEERPEDNKEKEPTPNPIWKEVLLFVRDVAVCMALVLLFSNYIARPVQVLGSSMYPTLQDQEFGFSNLIGMRMDGIKRFDIVIIYVDPKEKYLVKRVVGLPGETVSYTGGQLYINGEAVEENFFNEEYRSRFGTAFMEDVAPVTLGEDEYFCLGDNRPHSTDSRVYGPFRADQIRSKGVLVLFPFSEIGIHTW